jgi:hypothetical protein
MSCFRCCSSLRSVDFDGESKFREICDKAFFGSGLEIFSVPESVESLGLKSFSQCDSPCDVLIGESSRLGIIRKKAFFGSGLTSMIIPASTAIIGRQDLGTVDILCQSHFQVMVV